MALERRAVDVRAADEADIESLAKIWFDGWHDAHAVIVPAALTRLRTLDSFRDRRRADLDAVRVASADGSPIGFSMLRGAELDQFYLSVSARGSGVAALMMADAEARLAGRGVRLAWLAQAR